MHRLLNLMRNCKLAREAQMLSRAGLLKLQEQRWRAMARHALEVSPFYRKHLAGIDVERCQLTDIPPMTKELLLENWDEIVADPRLRRAPLEDYLKDPRNWSRLYHGRWMVGMTAGTTATALMTVHDVDAVDWIYATATVRRSASSSGSATVPSKPRLPRFRRRLKAIAFVTDASPAISAVMYATRPWVGALFTRYHLININQPWKEILAQVQRIQPDAMMGYASLLGRLAQAQLSGELSIRMPQDRGYLSAGGDATTPGIRDLCRRAFGIEPQSTYGCGETLGIARQLSGSQHLLCHDDLVVFEAVDAAGQPVPEGVLSDHALATPLMNKALPLLRYRINDRVKMGPADSEWPFRRIEQLIGRSAMSYTFRTPEPRVFIGMLFLFKMDERQDLLAYQFRQTAPDAVQALVVPTPGTDEASLISSMEVQMRHCLDHAGCTAVKASVCIVPQILPDPRTCKVEQNVPLKD
jgi:phenylacetate-CoA ligase